LLPFSVDGLIVASSLSLAAGGRPWLARVGLVLGVASTVAANVVFGVNFGVVGALVNAWPAVAFIVSSEILVGMVRGARDLPSAGETELDSGTEVPTPVEPEGEAVADAPGEAAQDGPSVPQDGPPDADTGRTPARTSGPSQGGQGAARPRRTRWPRYGPGTRT
jgi:hypothetical protein